MKSFTEYLTFNTKKRREIVRGNNFMAKFLYRSRTNYRDFWLNLISPVID